MGKDIGKENIRVGKGKTLICGVIKERKKVILVVQGNHRVRPNNADDLVVR